MSYREDYYKFSHNLLPHMIFNYGSYVLDWIQRDKKAFVDTLKHSWEKILLENELNRSSAPDFSIEIRCLNELQTLIVLSIPGSEYIYETPYIFISVDTDNLMNYFTCEIGEYINDTRNYYLCQWTREKEHINYQVFHDLELAPIIKHISEILVFDIL